MHLLLRRAAVGVVVLVSLALAGCPGIDTSVPDVGAQDASLDAAHPIDTGPPTCTGCLVAGTCHANGAANPASPCQACDTTRSTTAFSSADGAACDDGMFCTTADHCAAGSCTGTARDCDDTLACNGVGTCDETTDACVDGTTTCTAGQFCDTTTGNCELTCAGCVVGGTCYADGDPDPLDPCLVCRAATSHTAFSANVGASCDDGFFCSIDDTCDVSGHCQGGPPRCTDGIACNGAETCDEAADRCMAAAGICPSGTLCDPDTDDCIATCSGCVIGGVCYGAGQKDPTNECRLCDPARTTTAFSDADGASCDDGLFCTTSDVCVGVFCRGAMRVCGDGVSCNGVESCDEASDRCDTGSPTCATGTLCDPSTDHCVTTCAGCVIGGNCFGDGSINPGNACQICRAATSPTRWSSYDGARCDDGLFCTDGDTCSGGRCAGGARSCSDGVACNGVESCSESTHSCRPGTTTCLPSEICNTATSSCVATCTGCTVAGTCYAHGSTNPGNVCEICDVGRNRSAFSTNDGASCDDGLFCTGGDACAGNVCAGTSANFCLDTIACNGDETCNETTDRCQPGVTTCGMGTLCNTTTDTCDTTCAFTMCGASCVDTSNDPQHCGDCSTVCSPRPHTIALCGGTPAGCAYACQSGYLDCNGGTDGCETLGSSC